MTSSNDLVLIPWLFLGLSLASGYVLIAFKIFRVFLDFDSSVTMALTQLVTVAAFATILAIEFSRSEGKIVTREIVRAGFAAGFWVSVFTLVVVTLSVVSGLNPFYLTRFFLAVTSITTALALNHAVKYMKSGGAKKDPNDNAPETEKDKEH